MTVAQIRRMAKLTEDLPEDRKVNFTAWRDSTYVTLTFMNNEGDVWRYGIETTGTYKGELSG